MSSIRPSRLFAECGILYGLSLVATFANHVVTAPYFSDGTYLAVIVIMMLGPWICQRYIHRRSSEESGAEIVLSLRDAVKGLGVALALVLPVAFGVYVWQTSVVGLTFHPAWENYAQTPFLETIATQILLVAMPEEFFYRGYLMTTLRDAGERAFSWSPRKLKIAVIILTSLLFAIAHTMGGDVGRLNTFFPALLFGLLRTRCDGILGCILLHASCNLMMQMMLVHFIK